MSKFHIIHDGDITIIFLATSFLLVYLYELIIVLVGDICTINHHSLPIHPICYFLYRNIMWPVLIIISAVIAGIYYKISRRCNPQYYDPV